MNCLECGAQATESHHIVPKSLGGTQTVPLCGKCHARVHGMNAKRRDDHRYLTRLGLYRASETHRFTLALVITHIALYGYPRFKYQWPRALTDQWDFDPDTRPSLASILKHVRMFEQIVDMGAYDDLWALYDMNDRGERLLLTAMKDAMDNAGMLDTEHFPVATP